MKEAKTVSDWSKKLPQLLQCLHPCVATLLLDPELVKIIVDTIYTKQVCRDIIDSLLHCIIWIYFIIIFFFFNLWAHHLQMPEQQNVVDAVCHMVNVRGFATLGLRIRHDIIRMERLTWFWFPFHKLVFTYELIFCVCFCFMFLFYPPPQTTGSQAFTETTVGGGGRYYQKEVIHHFISYHFISWWVCM